LRIAVVGQGGREHALAWKLGLEGHTIVGLPGNPGIAEIGTCVAVNLADVESLAAACKAQAPDLVVVGPEAPLDAGLVDRLHALDVKVFGPTQKATRIESSKAYAKGLMRRAGVPTARFLTVLTAGELDTAIAAFGPAVAVKADGLAAGKGVVVCSEASEARAAGLRLLERGPVVVEERLSGTELSVIAMTDGSHVVVLPPSRDHKRLLDGDLGPNTGGMGAVAPVHVPESLMGEIRETILRPALAAMADDDAPFVGALFAGLMLTPSGPMALEFNARFGDPETQSILGTLAPDFPLGRLLFEAATGRLHEGTATASQSACTIVIASKGYPETPETGLPITGVEQARATGAQVFHAGTRVSDGRLVSNGGRVLGVMMQGRDLEDARRRALAAARLIQLPGSHLRTDIGATST
jgi:phosphoribosylamine--glycine ligase